MVDERRPNERAPVLIVRTRDGRFQDTDGSRELVFEVLQELVLDGTPFEIRDDDTGQDITTAVVNEIMDSLA